MAAQIEVEMDRQDEVGMDILEVVTILRRGWWLVLGLPLLVLAVSLATYRAPAVTYEARLRVAVDVPRSALVAGSDEGTAAKIGEALIDDIARIIPSEAFAEAVSARLPTLFQVSPGEIASDLSATDRHRIADVWVRRTAPPNASPAEVAVLEETLQAVASVTVAELEENGNTWFARLGEDNIALTVIDRPGVSPLPPTLRERIELPVRVALALLVGVALAFIRHALDPRLHTAAEAETLTHAPVLARVPSRRR